MTACNDSATCVFTLLIVLTLSSAQQPPYIDDVISGTPSSITVLYSASRTESDAFRAVACEVSQTNVRVLCKAAAGYGASLYFQITVGSSKSAWSDKAASYVPPTLQTVTCESQTIPTV